MDIVKYLKKCLVICFIALLSACTEPNQSNLEQKTELELAIEAYEKGIVHEGHWKGLKFRAVEKRPIEYLKFIEPDNNNVQEFNEKVKQKIENWSELSNIRKTEILYNELSTFFEHEYNPYNSLEYTITKDKPEIFNNEYKEIKEFANEYSFGIQTIDDTYKFYKGNCLSLSKLFVSHLRNAGIESYLIIVSEGEIGHVICGFDSGINVQESILDSGKGMLGIDPSSFKKMDFRENLKYTKKFFDPDLYHMVGIIKELPHLIE